MALDSNTAALLLLLQARDESGAVVTAADERIGKMSKTADLAKAAFHALSGVVAGELVGALSDAARKGAEEEASQTRLKVAANNTADGYDRSALSLQAAIDVAHQYGFATIEVNDSLALLTEQTGSADEAMKRITVAENLARGAHIDLYTASKLLGKATDENANTLGRFGVVVQKGADVTAMLGAVQAKFGGQAQAYGDTTAGAIDKTKVAIEDWQAKIGNSLGPTQQYIALLPGLTSGIQLAGGAFGGATSLITAHISSLKSLGVTLAAGGAVLVAIAAVGVALYEVGLTVQEVTDHWNTFVYALTTGRLNDIPVFGFFFGKIQMMLGLIQGAIDAWHNLTSLFGGGPATPTTESQSANYSAFVRGYANGGDFITNGPQLIRVGEAGPERVQVTPLGGGGAAGGDIVLHATLVMPDGAILARTVERYQSGDQRRRGLVAEPVGI